MANRKTSFSKRHLPHIYIPNSSYFITFRLAGSLPEAVLHKYKVMNRLAIQQIKISIADEKERERLINIQNDRYFIKIDKILDKCRFGDKYLMIEEIANIAASALKFYDKKEYKLLCYTIMPNHIHTVFTLEECSRPLSKIMQSLKGFTAYKANIILKRKGVFWQDESYDHIIRDVRDLRKKIYYVINNPVKAGLCGCSEDWPWTYTAEIPLD